MSYSEIMNNIDDWLWLIHQKPWELLNFLCIYILILIGSYIIYKKIKRRIVK
jgi:hypothetical protein